MVSIIVNLLLYIIQVILNTGIIDRVSKVELLKRDETIQELTTKFKKELKLRKETEQLKDQTEQQLVSRMFTCI